MLRRAHYEALRGSCNRSLELNEMRWRGNDIGLENALPALDPGSVLASS